MRKYNTKIIYEIYKAPNSKSLITKIKNVLHHPIAHKLYAITDSKELAKIYLYCNKDFSLYINPRIIVIDMYDKFINKYKKYKLHKYSNDNGDIIVIREMDTKKYKDLIKPMNNQYKLTKEDYTLLDFNFKR